MEGNLNFVLKLSLEEMALREVVVNLWKEKDIQSMIQNLRYDIFWYDVGEHIRDSKEWRENVEEKVKDKCLKLILPESLKKRMIPIVRLIGYQILSWKMFHEDLDELFLEHMYWTYLGVIDYKKTAEKIVSLETIDVIKRYRLACLYCLEDHIRVIWEKLPKNSEEIFGDKSDRMFDRRYIPLDIYWGLVLNGAESELNDINLNEEMNVFSSNQRVFLSSAKSGNKAAAEYFFQKLNIDERDSSLIKAASLILESSAITCRHIIDIPSNNLSDVLFHLMMKMSLQDRMKILQKYPERLFSFLLVWPWLDILLDTADFIWTFLPESDFESVMGVISHGISNTAYDFPELFREFLLRSPRRTIKHFVRFMHLYKFPFDLLTETIQSIIRDSDVGERAELVSSFSFLTHLKVLIAKDEWQTVKTYFREAKLSPEGIEVVKEALEEFSENDHFFESQESEDALDRLPTIDRLFRLLYETATIS